MTWTTAVRILVLVVRAVAWSVCAERTQQCTTSWIKIETVTRRRDPIARVHVKQHLPLYPSTHLCVYFGEILKLNFVFLKKLNFQIFNHYLVFGLLSCKIVSFETTSCPLKCIHKFNELMLMVNIRFLLLGFKVWNCKKIVLFLFVASEPLVWICSTNSMISHT